MKHTSAELEVLKSSIEYIKEEKSALEEALEDLEFKYGAKKGTNRFWSLVSYILLFLIVMSICLGIFKKTTI